MSGRLIVFLAAMGLLAGAARAEIFVLAKGGEVRGELVNGQESPRQTYVIRLPGGGELTLAKDQVSEVRQESPAQLEYERRRAEAQDTVDDHWALAEYCRENRMLSTRNEHLRRIVELAPNHAAARRALGYSRIDGQWKTQEQVMTERGYVYYKGAWRLPQEVELEEARRKAELVEVEWKGNLKRWRSWLGTNRTEQALEFIEQITDPNAVSAIAAQLEDERDPKVRRLWVEVLGRIDSPVARTLLVKVSIEDVDLETRLTAIDQLAKTKHRDVVDQYVKALKSTENPLINRAAVGLAAMGDTSAVGPLIDVLVTTHKHKVSPGSGAISSTFSTAPGGGPSGLSVNSRPSVITRTYANQDVRDALVKLTGMNFSFDIERWKLWHAAQRKEEAVNVRRD